MRQVRWRSQAVAGAARASCITTSSDEVRHAERQARGGRPLGAALRKGSPRWNWTAMHSGRGLGEARGVAAAGSGASCGSTPAVWWLWGLGEVTD